MEYSNGVELQTLKSRGRVIGTKRPVTLSKDVVTDSNCTSGQNDLRVVNTYEEARSIAAGSAALFIAAMT
jgi:hypothetical protein